MIRSFHHSAFPVELMRERKRETVTVVLPAREVADTIAPIVETLTALDLIDQVLVIDAASQDGSGELARSLGAEVHQESELVSDLGPVLGKGDAMWRALSVSRGDVIVYMDSDTRDFQGHFVCGLLGPLLVEDGVEFVKASFRRPFDGEPTHRPLGAGRVTELTARPLFSAFYPELAAFAQPLAGEVAARRTLFERVPFACGYAVETSMLLHIRELVGVARMAQVDLDERRQRHQSLEQLGPMSYAVLRVILERLRREGRLLDDHAPPLRTGDGRLVQVDLIERPPFASLRAPA